MKVAIKLGKVKKFGIGWCIPHRMAADKAKGGQTPPPSWYRVKTDIIKVVLVFSMSNFFIAKHIWQIDG